MLTFGIPEFKLEKEVVKRRREVLEGMGVEFVLDTEIGTDILFEQLLEDYDAVFLGMGTYTYMKGGFPGEDKVGVYEALPYLVANNKKQLELDSPEYVDLSGQKVIVLGGGDTAMDCVRTAIRQKAKSVSCLYRRDKINMPGSAREVQNAEEEGVKFIWLSSPKEFVGNEKVHKVIYDKIKLGEPDSSGRQSPKVIEGAQDELPADMIIKSLGFDPEEIPSLFSEPELKVSKWGTIKIDLKTMRTNIRGVFAAGDIVRGASLVVWAIRDGRDAAQEIHKYIKIKSQQFQTKVA